MKHFIFQKRIVKKVYDSYKIEKVFRYHVLTGTDNICIMFIFVCKIDSNTTDDEFRNIIFEVTVSTIDRSHQFWEKFNVRDETSDKKLGYYKIDSW